MAAFFFHRTLISFDELDKTIVSRLLLYLISKEQLMLFTWRICPILPDFLCNEISLEWESDIKYIEIILVTLS